LNVISRRQLRHYPAEDPMQLDLAEKLMRQQTALAVENGHGAFVTG
jgi:hypothetical protein